MTAEKDVENTNQMMAAPYQDLKQKLKLNLGSTQGTIPSLEHHNYMPPARVNLPKTGNLNLPGQPPDVQFTAEDLTDEGEIGRGSYGTVNRMRHCPSDFEMAVKRIRSTVDEKQQKQMLMDLEVVVKSSNFPYIVQFYGALFKEGDCWICMELMATSLDKFYKYVYQHQNTQIPEAILSKISYATVRALSYLKQHLNIIHRDVKPSNILIDRSGNIKLCDFGIAGQLVDSIAKSRDAGCRPYMAPERIDPKKSSGGYDIRSDVWSLGIALMELATGKFPYPRWNSMFEQLQQVVAGNPPRLEDPKLSSDCKDFVNLCLTKEVRDRPKYNKLLEHAFIADAGVRDDDAVDVGMYFCSVLDQVPPGISLADFLTNSS